MRRPLAILACGLALVAVCVGAGRRFSHYQGNDLPWAEKFRELDAGKSARGDHTLEHVASALRTAAGERGMVFVPSIDSRVYVLAGRPWAGLVPHLAIPLSPHWEMRALGALELGPPAAIAWQRSHFAAQRKHEFEVGERNSQIMEWLKHRYTRVLFQEGEWEVRVPAAVE